MEKYKRQVHTLKERLEDKKAAKQSKEDLATVSLGTSKINYLDPRISVAWCKKYGIPLAKVFNKSLIAKFPWAMEVSSKWRFGLDECPENAYHDSETEDKEDAAANASDDDDDVPLAKKAAGNKTTKSKAAATSSAKKAVKRKKPESDGESDSDSDDDVPLTKRKKEDHKVEDKPGSDDSSSDDDDMPLSKRTKTE